MVVHIENKEMADAAEEICQIPQIDVVFVGPAEASPWHPRQVHRSPRGGR